VADHVHLTLGAQPKESPAEVALRYMNNLAFASGMKPIFEFGYFVGTFGEYNLKVIPRPDQSALRRDKPAGDEAKPQGPL